MKLGLILLCIYLIISQGKKLKNLQREVRKLTKAKGEDKTMSMILEELVGSKCSIQFEDDVIAYEYTVLAIDEEWVKLRYEDKKGNIKNYVVRIDNIKQIEF